MKNDKTLKQLARKKSVESKNLKPIKPLRGTNYHSHDKTPFSDWLDSLGAKRI